MHSFCPEVYSELVNSGSKKTTRFFKCLMRKVQVQGLPFLKIKEFTCVNDCFQKGRNAEIGLFVQALNVNFMGKYILFLICLTATVKLTAQPVTYTNTTDTSYADTLTYAPTDTTSKAGIRIVDSSLIDSMQASLRACQIRNTFLSESLKRTRNTTDSLNIIIERYETNNMQYTDSLEVFKRTCDSLSKTTSRLQHKNEILRPLNQELSLQIKNLQNKIDSQSNMLNKQIRIIKEKEQLFKEKELIYQNAIQETKIDLVKLEGQLQSKSSEISGKEREIELLAESISDRKEAIKEKNREIQLIRHKRESANIQLDTLRDYLKETQMTLALTKEKLKYANKEIVQLKQKIESMTQKDKKIRIVQGIGIRNFRNPQYNLQPESSENPDNYVISNENAGSYEFDFITGASFKLIELNKKDAKFKSDAGFFIGFGGKNLFKNFYIGPNVKLFDVIHINAGINISEFKLLKSGFSEGDRVDQGATIPTVSQWKISPYFGLTFDLSLITSIAGKL